MTHQWPTGSYDVLQKELVVVFCGLNPSIEAATTGHNFGSASNRFWRALHLAGFTSHQIAAEDDRTLLRFGCGVTAAVGRPTRSASEIGSIEFRRSAEAFERKVAYYRPHAIAFLGKSAYAAMTGLRDLDWGAQSRTSAPPERGCCPIRPASTAHSRWIGSWNITASCGPTSRNDCRALQAAHANDAVEQMAPSFPGLMLGICVLKEAFEEKL
jgi:TDG/mug DNA glycosylase family protein